MATQFGFTSIGSSSATVADNWANQCYVSTTATYVAASGDTLTQFAVYGGGTVGGCEVALYVISAGVPTTKVGASSFLTFTTTAGWVTATVSIALTAGVRYGMAIRWSYDDNWTMRYQAGPGGTQSSNGVQNVTLPSTWSQTGTDTSLYSFYATATPASTGVSGSGAVTEPHDVSDGVGTILGPNKTGSGAVTEVHDSSAGAGTRTTTTVIFTDDFNRANTAAGGVGLGPDWYHLPTSWYINANTATKLVGDHYARVIYPMPGDQFVEADIPKAKLENYMWMHVRAPTYTVTTGGPGQPGIYEGGINTTTGGGGTSQGEVGIIHLDGTYTVLGRGNVVYSTTGPMVRVRLEVVGNRLRFYTDGNLIIDTVDPLDELHGDYVGLNCFLGATGDGWYDNFVGGQYVPPPVSGSGDVAEHADTSSGVGDWTGLGYGGSGDVIEPHDASVGVGHFLAPTSTGGIIGWNVAETTIGSTADNWDDTCYVSNGSTYVAGPADTVTELWVYGDGPAHPDVALYVISGGVPTTRVSSKFSVFVDATPGWYMTPVSIPLTLGVRYGVAIDWWTDGSWRMRYNPGPGGVTASNGSWSGALPTTWAQIGTETAVSSFYAVVSGASISRSGSGNVTEVGDGSAGVGTILGPDRTGSGAAVERHDSASAIGAIGALRYPASISGRKLLDQTGNVILMRTMSSWAMASHLTNAQITTALEQVKASGFNGVTVWIGGTQDWGSGWHTYTNATGNPFWNGTPWRMASGTSLGAAWASVDWIAAETQRLGLVPSFSFCGGNGTNGCGDDWEAASNADMFSVGVAIATRYASYPHILWHVMLDDGQTPATVRGQRIKQTFAGIASVEGLSRPVRWMEMAQGNTVVVQGWYADSDVRPFNCVYDYSGSSTSIIETGYAQTTGPTGDCEPPYIGAPHYGGPWNDPNVRQEVRERNYSHFIEGGCLMNYGHEDWWPFGASGIYSAGLSFTQVFGGSPSDTVDQTQASYCWAFIDQWLRSTSFAPQSLLAGGSEGTGTLRAAQGASVTTAVAYFPNSRPVTVNTNVIPGSSPVRLQWFDPVTGGYTVISASESTQSGRVLTMPGPRADATSDYVLVVDALFAPGGAGAFLGTNPITAAYIGTTPVTKIYVGTNQAWP